MASSGVKKLAEVRAACLARAALPPSVADSPVRLAPLSPLL